MKPDLRAERPISETFCAIADYAVATGQAPIKGKLFEVKLDESWHFWVNATDEAKEVEGALVQPFECYVKFNGWPAATFTPYEGIFAAGAAANEKTFCAALREAIKRHKEAN